MELNHEAVHEAPRPSASIVLLRDAPAGLEVFLLQRHGDSSAFGGAHVFAGGKVDAADAQVDAARRLDQPPSVLAHRLGEPLLSPAEATGLHVAAVRELFEEAGVLMTEGADAAAPDRMRQLLRSGCGFHDALDRLDLRLHTALLAPWSRWITPKVPSVSRRRFDTRFFLAPVPADQQAVHDNHEAVDSAWLTPRAALQAYWERRIDFAPPQIMSLVQLCRHASVDSALEAAARLCAPPCIEPHGFLHEGQRAVCYPGDPLHPVPQRCMDGPTRLYIRAGRFEPEGGLASLLS